MDVFANGESPLKIVEEHDTFDSQLLNDLLFSTLSSEVSNTSGASSGRQEDNEIDDVGRKQEAEEQQFCGGGSDEELFNAFINTDILPHEAGGSHQALGAEGSGLMSGHGVEKERGERQLSRDVSGRSENLGLEEQVSVARSQVGGGEPLVGSNCVLSQSQPLVSPLSSRVATPHSSYYQQCENFFNQRLEFGRTEPLRTAYLNPADFLDLDMSKLPYTLTVSDMPTRSRVETQIKLDITISPAPKQYLIHLPSDCITKQKLYLSADEGSNPPDVRNEMLYLEAFLICTSNNKATYVCNRCVKREQRRAARRKSGLSDNLIWCNNENRRAVVFNSKQVFLIKQENCTPTSKSFSLSTRIVCYCRHHKEPEGFRVMFILRDANGEILAKNVTSPIMIMDKKSNKRGTEGLKGGESNSATDLSSLAKTAGECSTAPTSDFSGAENSSNNKEPPTSTGVQFLTNAPMLSPSSIGADSSETAGNADLSQHSHSLHFASSSAAAAQRASGYKRKRTWPDPPFPILETSSRGAVSASDRSYSMSAAVASSNHLTSMTQLQQHAALPKQSQIAQQNKPFIHRVIPNQGPIKGGTEVTLLGTNFRPGDIVKFGENRALSTQCWSDSTIVTYLPPAASPGKVLVSVFSQEDLEQDMLGVLPKSTVIFTYVDDTDRQLIELALQIVGLKMNGKLEDARNIAKRIIGSDAGSSNDSTPNNVPNSGQMYRNQLLYSDENLLVKVIKLLNPTSNLSMCTEEGHTMLHLACLKGYHQLVSLLVRKGARVEVGDSYGFTPLHFACLNGDAKIIRLLVQCKAQVSTEAKNGTNPVGLFLANHQTNDERYKHYFNEVMDVLTKSDYEFDSYNLGQRKLSVSSCQSSLFDEESINSVEEAFHADDSKSIYGSFSSGSEEESSNYEEDGDESLLYNDESSEQADFRGHTPVIDDDATSSSIRGSSNVRTRTQTILSQVSTSPNSVDSHENSNRNTSSHENSLWNRVLSAFNDSPPNYEDLFPSTENQVVSDSKLQVSSATPLTSHNLIFDNPCPSILADELQTSSEDEDEALQARFNRFFQERTNFQNDKMLLLFWLPLLVILLPSFLLIKFGQDGNTIQHISQKASECLRMWVVKFMLGNERMKTMFRESLNNFQSRRILGDVLVT